MKLKQARVSWGINSREKKNTQVTTSASAAAGISGSSCASPT